MDFLPDDWFVIASACALVAASLYAIHEWHWRLKNRPILCDPVVVKSGHSWYAEPLMQRGHYCNVCKHALAGGYVCSSCRLRVDEPACLRSASEKLPCKVNEKSVNDKILKHHWVTGNLDPEDFCAVCNESCGDGIGLKDFWCAWCHRAAHARCMNGVRDECDRDALAASVIPPNCVTIRKAGNRNQKEMVIESVTIPEDVTNFHPVIVIVNPKSGSGAGDIVARAFRNFLHPIQIVDVTKSNMKAVLRWIDTHEDIEARIIIAGGDGTISLVLDDIDELARPPPVAVVPIGTGNDLSRVINWGAESDGRMDPKELLSMVQDAKIVKLDRWTINIEHSRRLGFRQSTRRLSMTNYVSIGVDACVTYGMQNTRDSIPRALSSRMLNKFLFFTFGTKDIFDRACRNLQSRIELSLDGVPVELPDIEGLIFLNIKCWGAGVKVWEDESDDGLACQNMNDGKFEVFAVQSSFHIAKLQVGLSSPIRIGQASTATLKVRNGPLPMQSDGEAWMQGAAVITLSHKGQSLMLENGPKKGRVIVE